MDRTTIKFKNLNFMNKNPHTTKIRTFKFDERIKKYYWSDMTEKTAMVMLLH